MKLHANTGLAALALLMVSAPPASAEIIEITWDANGGHQGNLSVAPGKLAELCGKLPAGLKLRWRFEASAPLDFNVHHHVDKEVVYATRLDAVASATATLQTKTEQDHCWMWRNKSAATATLTVRLQR